MTTVKLDKPTYITKIDNHYPPVCYVLPKKDSEDGNAYVIMAQFRRKALDAGWQGDHIEAVLQWAMDGNYDELRAKIATFCINY